MLQTFELFAEDSGFALFVLYNKFISFLESRLDVFNLFQVLGLRGGGGPDPAFLLLVLRESGISLSFHIVISHPVPNFGESRFPGTVKSRIS